MYLMIISSFGDDDFSLLSVLRMYFNDFLLKNVKL